MHVTILFSVIDKNDNAGKSESTTLGLEGKKSIPNMLPLFVKVFERLSIYIKLEVQVMKLSKKE